MNREKVYGLASEALAARAEQVMERTAAVPSDPPDEFRRAAGRMAPYDRSSFLYDLAHQLAEAAAGSRPQPDTDEAWAEAVVRSYLARTAAATAGTARE